MKILKSNLDNEVLLYLHEKLQADFDTYLYFAGGQHVEFFFSDDSEKAEIEALFAQDINNVVEKEKQIKVKYLEMVSDVYAEMGNVFGTKNDVSAQAFAATYEAMVKRPANYVGQLGLETEAAVLAYAEAKIAEADVYAVYRLNRIAQFQAEKDAILNS